MCVRACVRARALTCMVGVGGQRTQRGVTASIASRPRSQTQPTCRQFGPGELQPCLELPSSIAVRNPPNLPSEYIFAAI